MVLQVVYVAEQTFGEFLAGLRGAESPASVQRRMARIGRDITGRYITVLETGGVKEPGVGILATLAVAYAGRMGWQRDALFWELWRRAGYPLPAGFAAWDEEIRGIAELYLRLGPQGRKEMTRWAETRAAGDTDAQDGGATDDDGAA